MYGTLKITNKSSVRCANFIFYEAEINSCFLELLRNLRASVRVIRKSVGVLSCMPVNEMKSENVIIMQYFKSSINKLTQ